MQAWQLSLEDPGEENLVNLVCEIFEVHCCEIQEENFDVEMLENLIIDISESVRDRFLQNLDVKHHKFLVDES